MWPFPWNIVAGVGAPVVAIIVWALFVSPRAVLAVHPFVRAIVELLVYVVGHHRVVEHGAHLGRAGLRGRSRDGRRIRRAAPVRVSRADVLALLRAALGDRVDTTRRSRSRRHVPTSRGTRHPEPRSPCVNAASVADVQATLRIATRDGTPVVTARRRHRPRRRRERRHAARSCCRCEAWTASSRCAPTTCSRWSSPAS